jgi:Bacterial Ig-like domain (group 3)
MQRRVILAFALAAACCALAVATGAAAFAAKAPAGHLGSARGVSGAVAAMAGGAAQAEVQSVSCASAGNCAGGGSFTDAAGKSQGFVATEKGGAWGAARQVPGRDSATSGMVNSVSCGRAGNCVAGGSAMTTGPFSDAFLADEVKGRWGGAREVPGLAAINHGSAQVDTVSCAAAGDCAALGGYVDASGLTQVFVTEEKNGSWSDARPLPGLAFLNRRGLAFVHSVSCAAPGDCVAVGSYLGAGGFTQAYEAEETRGAWLDAQPVNGVPSLNSGNSGSTAVSCVSPGNCTVAGFYSDVSHHEQVFVADERSGTWELAQPVPGAAARNSRDASVTSLSCASPGNCGLAGFVTDTAGQHQAFLDSELGGDWRQAQLLTGTGTVSAWQATEVHAVSCAAAGDCVAGGSAVTAGLVQRAFVVREQDGTWGTASELPGSAALNAGKTADLVSVSCASPGNCAVGGSYTDGSGRRHAMVADESAVTATSLALSAAKIRFGHEQAEKISVKVTGRTGGTPGGKVTLKAGSATICVITLAHGKGACTLAARKLRPGSYRLTAAYGGSQTYAGSASRTKTISVVK